MARCPFEFCGGETTLAYTLSAFDVLQCGRCGIRYRHPFPTSQEMDAMYADADYHSAGYFADQFDEASASLPERAIYADLLSLLHGGAGKRLLDVGSGAGLFLRMASEAGYQAEGVELSSALAERSAAQWGVR
ncbi:MAG TPA: methyltransferase domain-containing protein, partial [Candidatus Binatia bacterium]|nr:methyltransferase domain-containing protein [Candidatus Binatia bacterium]